MQRVVCDSERLSDSSDEDEGSHTGFTVVKINGETHVFNAESGPGVLDIPGMRNLQIGDGHIRVTGRPAHRSRHRTYSPPERHRDTQGQRQHTKLTDSTAKVSRSDLNFVCKNIGKQWKKLGSVLGLSRGQIEAIEVDFHVEGNYEMAYQTLLKWKRQNGDQVTVRDLVHALDATGLSELAQELPVR